jgi:hypothetical protein
MNMFLMTAVPELGEAAVDAPITTPSAIDLSALRPTSLAVARGWQTAEALSGLEILDDGSQRCWEAGYYQRFSICRGPGGRPDLRAPTSIGQRTDQQLVEVSSSKNLVWQCHRPIMQL